VSSLVALRVGAVALTAAVSSAFVIANQAAGPPCFAVGDVVTFDGDDPFDAPWTVVWVGGPGYENNVQISRGDERMMCGRQEVQSAGLLHCLR